MVALRFSCQVFAMPRPALLCILDGWGWRADAMDNAIAQGTTPNYTRMLATLPHALLATSGRAVGLPAGQMGNSEVGHMNIGSGRVVSQDLPRIDTEIEDGKLAYRVALQALKGRARDAHGAVHIMGLLSPGGVHSHQDHMVALVKVICEAELPVFVHAFLDGRDTPPKSARGYLEKFLADIKGCPGVRLATVSGRYYAMDRDQRWERIEKAYDAMVNGAARRFDDAFAALDEAYAKNATDEFVLPCVLGDYRGMANGDALLFANFRADRARQICLSLLDPAFTGFKRGRVIDFSAAAGMTEYSDELKPMMSAVFAPQDVRETLGEIAAEHNLKQLRIAETEKYAHVTFFLNGGREEPFPGEDRIMVPSPKVATYDKQPEMSARELTAKLVEAIGSGKYDLIVANYANPDMVGHTGIMTAAIAAVDVIDECLGQLSTAIEKAGGAMLLTADHGNVELMKDPETGEPHTAHTTFDVPILVQGAPPGSALENGALSDVAPTMLALMDLPQPAPMTGHSLLSKG